MPTTRAASPAAKLSGVASRVACTVLLFACTGCDGASTVSDPPPASVEAASSGVPVPSSASTRAPMDSGRPPWPVVAACPPGASGYFIRIEGDGEAQELRQGALRFPAEIRSCQPDAYPYGGKLSIAACQRVPTNGQDARRSCFWAHSDAGAYLDRAGIAWQLTVVRHDLKITPSPAGGVVDATMVLVGRSRGTTKELRLSVRAHVGRDVPAVAAPGTVRNWPTEF